MSRTWSATLALATVLGVPSLAAAKPTVKECTDKLKATPAKVELKMVTLAPAGSKWAQEFQAWSDDALVESDCRVVLKWYWNGGGGGDEMRMVADLRQGQKHGAAMTAVGLAEIYKDILVFQLPGLFDNWPALDATRDAEKGFFEAEFAKKGFVILGWGDVGAAKLMTVGHEIKKPSDLKDKTAWYLPGDPVSPLLYSQVGLKSNAVSIGELGSHLGKDINVINIAPYAAEQLQLSSKVTHMTAMTTAFVIGGLVIKKEKMDSMPADLREIVMKTGKAHAESLTKTIRGQDGEAFGRMKKSKTTYTPTAEELKEWHAIFASTRKALRGAPLTPEVFDRIVKR